MSIMVTVEFPLQSGKLGGFLDLLGVALKDTRAFEGCEKVDAYAEEDGSSIVLIEVWKEKANHQEYMAWRMETGLGELIAPFVSGAPAIRYFKYHDNV